MPKISKKSLTILIVIGIVVVLGGIKFIFRPSGTGPKSVIPARARGNPNAAIHTVEYLDFQCPDCAEGSKFLGQYLREHPDKIYIEMKYFPLSSKKHSLPSARYAECAARQGKFWPFQDLLFQRQKQWVKQNDARPAFEQVAKEVGLDLKELEVCLEDESVTQLILKEKAEGKALRIYGTPTYFINGKMLVGPKSLIQELGKYSGEKAD